MVFYAGNEKLLTNKNVDNLKHVSFIGLLVSIGGLASKTPRSYLRRYKVKISHLYFP